MDDVKAAMKLEHGSVHWVLTYGTNSCVFILQQKLVKNTVDI